jgi:hypothetical protein
LLKRLFGFRLNEWHFTSPFWPFSQTA